MSWILHCPHCRRPAEDSSPGVRLFACPVCRPAAPAEVRIYRAALAGPAAPAAAGQGAEGSAAICLRHSRRAAVASCERCGRFLCALCAVEVGGRSYCTGCLEPDKDGVAGADLPSDRIHYPITVLQLALLPIGIFVALAPLALLHTVWMGVALALAGMAAAPVASLALVLHFFGRRAPAGPVPARRWVRWAGFSLAVTQVLTLLFLLGIGIYQLLTRTLPELAR